MTHVPWEWYATFVDWFLLRTLCNQVRRCHAWWSLAGLLHTYGNPAGYTQLDLYSRMLLDVDSTQQNLFVFWWEAATDIYFVQYRSKSTRVLSQPDWRFIPSAFVVIADKVIHSTTPGWQDLNHIIASQQLD